MRDRREQLPGLALLPAAAPQHLALHGQLAQRADFLLGQPRADERGEGPRLHPFAHALKGGVARRIIPAILLIALAAQGAQLALGELLAGVLERAIAARAHEGRDGGARQDKALAMTQAMTAPRVRQGGETIQQALQARRAKGTRPGRGGFVDGQRRGPAR